MIISKADPCPGMQPSFSQAHDDLLKDHFRFDPTTNVLSMLHMRTHLRALCHCQYVDLVCMSSTANIVGSSSCYQHLRCRGPYSQSLYPRLPPSSSIQSERHLALRSPFPYVWCSRNRVSRVRGLRKYSDTAGAGKTGL
jgi:hypothetical protein